MASGGNTVHTLNASQFTDYQEHSSGFRRLTRIVAVKDTVYAKVAYRHYADFANCEIRNTVQIHNRMKTLMPALAYKGFLKRQEILNRFEEVLLRPDTLLETQNTEPSYLWLILKGDCTVFQRPPGLYPNDKSLTDVRNLENF